MRTTLKRWKQRWLKFRITVLEADIAVMIARRIDARVRLEAMDQYIPDAQSRLRQLRAELSLLQPAREMLDEALSRSSRCR